MAIEEGKIKDEDALFFCDEYNIKRKNRGYGTKSSIL
jgi:hypothetical protein